MIKTDAESMRGVLTAGLEAGRILDDLSEAGVAGVCGESGAAFGDWGAGLGENIQDAMEPHRINAFEHLVQRVGYESCGARWWKSHGRIKKQASKKGKK